MVALEEEDDTPPPPPAPPLLLPLCDCVAVVVAGVDPKEVPSATVMLICMCTNMRKDELRGGGGSEKRNKAKELIQLVAQFNPQPTIASGCDRYGRNDDPENKIGDTFWSPDFAFFRSSNISMSLQ